MYVQTKVIHANDRISLGSSQKRTIIQCDAVQYAVQTFKRMLKLRIQVLKWALVNDGPTLDDYVKGRA